MLETRGIIIIIIILISAPNSCVKKKDRCLHVNGVDMASPSNGFLVAKWEGPVQGVGVTSGPRSSVYRFAYLGALIADL